MGCTSSAPNMANTSTAEKSIQFEEEYSEEISRDVEEIIYRATDEIKVLPSCDTLPELVNLVRNKSTASLKDETVTTEMFADNVESGHLSEIIKKVQSSEKLDKEEKLPRLEEVVEKVVELHNKTEHVEDIQTTEKVSEDSSKTEETTDNHNIKGGSNEDKNGQDTSDDQDKKDDEHPGEAISPSQSESSRATRWEALADIAAELPPSFTVDPVTGQIFSK